MGRVLKFFAYVFGAFVLLAIIAIVAFNLLFDANSYREQIAEAVEDATGRTFEIEGDLEVSFFPWLAIELGRTRLGNAEGFGPEPFAEFERARLSVEVMPLFLEGRVSIDTVELASLAISLAVNEQGVSNWDDLAEAGGEDIEPAEPGDAADPETGVTVSASPTLEIGGVDFNNASLVYRDATTDSEYRLSNFNVHTGPIASAAPIDIESNFSVAAEPAGITADTEIELTVSFDQDAGILTIRGFQIGTVANGVVDAPITLAVGAPAITVNMEDSVVDPGELAIEFMNVRLTADVDAFSYSGDPTPNAALAIDAFSPRTLAQQLGVDMPPTVDPNTFELLSLEADAAITDTQVRLDGLTLRFDDTTFTGGLIVPRDPSGRFELDLAGDRIDVTRYMAPSEDGAVAESAGDQVDVEIPVDMIRALNARGNLSLAEGRLGNLDFTGVELGINAADGKLRFHPITAEFFDGRYEGDTRIDASGDETIMAVDERIEGVSLGPLAKAMADRENITGEINGRFNLSGRGNFLSDIQRTLTGTMTFELSDGAFEGTDLWWELRRARALFRREEPPEPTLPARTRFSEVRATGNVINGVMKNEDFVALLPFIELKGRGAVNLVEASTEYYMDARVLDKPELADVATPEEIEDLTQVVIPLRIDGPLASPKVGVDFEKIIQDRVKQEVEEKIEDELKDALKGLFKKKD
ncbi:MAG: AsmA family protein [Pseudomonadota bacterium]